MIGIAGGAGPYAGAALFCKIIEETDALSDQEHVPVILWSVPEKIPDRTEYLEGRVNENPALSISRVFLELDRSGATVAAIPCNTAHAPVIYNEVKRQLQKSGSRLEILNMLDETVLHLKKYFPKGVSVGVLSTTGTWRRKIYRNVLENAGFHVLDSESMEEQERIHQAIYHKEFGVKAQASPVTYKAREVLCHAAEELIRRGAKVVVLGCTEIPLAIKASTIMEVPVVDTLRVLARALIRSESPEKLKEWID